MHYCVRFYGRCFKVFSHFDYIVEGHSPESCWCYRGFQYPLSAHFYEINGWLILLDSKCTSFLSFITICMVNNETTVVKNTKIHLSPSELQRAIKPERNTAELHWITSTWLQLLLLHLVRFVHLKWYMRFEARNEIRGTQPHEKKNIGLFISIRVAMVDWFLRGCINFSYTNDVLNVNNQRFVLRFKRIFQILNLFFSRKM